MYGRIVSTEETWSLWQVIDKRERAAYLRRVAEMLSLKDHRRQFLSDAAALEAEADRIEGRAAGKP
jgi:hypothetical protein